MPRKASTCLLLSGCVCVCVIPPVSACSTHQGPTDRGGAGRGVGRQACGSMYTQPKTGVRGCKCSITMLLTEYIKNKEAADVYNAVGKPRIVPALPPRIGESAILLLLPVLLPVTGHLRQCLPVLGIVQANLAWLPQCLLLACCSCQSGMHSCCGFWEQTDSS